MLWLGSHERPVRNLKPARLIDSFAAFSNTMTIATMSATMAAAAATVPAWNVCPSRRRSRTR